MNKKLKEILKELFNLQKEIDPEFNLQEFIAEFESETKSLKLQYFDLKNFEITQEKSLKGALRIKAIVSSDSVDRDGDMVLPEGIETPNSKHGKLPMFFQHDSSMSLGYWDKWELVDNTFVMEGVVLSPVTEWQKDVFDKILNQALYSVSIGFIPKELEFREMDAREIRVFKKIELFECSVVGIPANQDAHITEVEQLSEEPSDESEEDKSVKTTEQKSSNVETDQNPDPAPAVEIDNAVDAKELADLKDKVSELEKENARLQGELEEAEQVLSDLNSAVEQLNEIKRLK